MFDNAQRSLYLENQLWPSLREEFSSRLGHLPKEALVQVGYPASGARGRSDKIKPCEFNYNWHGNPNEKAFVSVHPIYFQGTDKKEVSINVAKALLFGACKVSSARWGASSVGLSKDDNGTIDATPDCLKRIEKVLEQCGELPDGYGVAFPVRTVQRARLRKYWARTGYKTVDGTECKHAVIRAATDTLSVECKDCGNSYQLA